MCKWLRTALVCLLILALPIQAMAAFGMQLCQQVHGSSALHGMLDHGAEHAVMMDAQNSKPAHHPTNAASCSLCAFCVSAVVIDQPLVYAGQIHRSEPPRTLSERLVSIVPGTPERPPRPSFF
jgi:hypothetical protein